jgi:hypothetical protein
MSSQTYPKKKPAAVTIINILPIRSGTYLPPDPAQAPIMEPLNVAAAINWLAEKLRQNPEAKKDDYRDECIETFRVSKLDYKAKIWPAARRIAGLGEALSGRRKKINR